MECSEACLPTLQPGFAGPSEAGALLASALQGDATQRTLSKSVRLTLSNEQIKAWAKLTKRERACIDAMLSGHYSDKAIARVVGLQAYTVADYLKQARSKLGITSRTGLALTALLLTLREEPSAGGIERMNNVASAPNLSGSKPRSRRLQSG